MCVADEMREAIIALAGPRKVFDSREAWLRRAAMRADISPRQAYSFFYKQTRNPSAEAVDKVRAAAKQCGGDQTNKSLGEDHARQLAELTERIERLEALLAKAVSDAGASRPPASEAGAFLRGYVRGSSALAR